ncbi:MAG: hypothetical protein Q8Q38_01375 [bacterium]|nr:hypothetical protein [bacterium]
MVLIGVLVGLILLLGGVLLGLLARGDSEQASESPQTQGSLATPGEEALASPPTTSAPTTPSPAPVESRAEATPAETVVATATPDPTSSPTSTPNATSTPTPGKQKSTYRNDAVGFELDYPGDWPFAEVTEFEDQGLLVLMGFDEGEGSARDQVVLPGPKIDTKWEPLPPESSLSAAAKAIKGQWEKAASSGTLSGRLISEEWVTLPSGIAAVRFVIAERGEEVLGDESPIYLVVVNGYLIEINGLGHYASEVDKVARSLRIFAAK